MELANAYGETNLMKDCVEMIKIGISVSNVAFIYKKAIKYSKVTQFVIVFYYNLLSTMYLYVCIYDFRS